MNQRMRFWLRESFLPATFLALAGSIGLLLIEIQAVTNLNQEKVVRIDAFTQQRNPEAIADAVDIDTTIVEPAATTNAVAATASAHMKAGEWKTAEAVLLEAIRSAPTSGLWTTLGVLYFKQGNNVSAYEAYEKAEATGEHDPSLFFHRGVLHATMGRYKQAIEDYRRFTAAYPHHYLGTLNLGIAYLKSGEIDQAVRLLETAVTLAGGDKKARAYYNLGIAYSRQTPPALAKSAESFSNAIRIRPDYVEARYWQALVEPDTTDGRQNAIDQLLKVVALRPNYAPAYFKLGLLYTAQQRHEQAKQAYTDAVRYDPENSKARYNLGLLLLENQQWTAAREQFNHALALDSANAKIHFNLGRLASAEKAFDEAIRHYHDALAMSDNSYPEAHLNMGMLYARKKMFEEAEKAYQAALDQRPDYAEAWYNLGLMHLRRDKPGEAQSAFERAIALNAGYAPAWFNLGVLRARENNNDGAIEAYQKALAIRPDYTEASLNLAVRYAKMGRSEDAIRLYKTVVAKDPTYVPAWLNLGVAYLDLDNGEAAELAFRNVIQLDPESSLKARRYLARVLTRRKDYDEAISVLREAINREPSIAALRTELAKALRTAGREDEAKQEFDKAKRLKDEKDDRGNAGDEAGILGETKE